MIMSKLAKAWPLAGMLLLLSLVSAVVAIPRAQAAAAPALTATQKTAFDRTAAASDKQLADKLKGQLRDYDAVVRSMQDWEQRTAALHDRNELDLSAVRKRIAAVDADKLARLKRDVDETKARYKPMFELYTATNKQLTVARKLKSKTMKTILQAQADALKITTQLARQEIKSKEAAYQTAKTAASAKMKKIRATLSGTDALKVRIRTAKSALKAPRDSRASVWRSFTAALTKKDAKSASRQLETILALSNQLQDGQRKIHDLETQIGGIIRTAQGQLS